MKALITFDQALIQLKAGQKVAREGWNGKGMWVSKGDGCTDLPADQFWNPHAREHANNNGGVATVQPYLLMKNAQGEIQMGWAPTQSDLFADDWQIV